MMFSEKWAIIHLRELHSKRGDHWPRITQLGNSPVGMLSTYLSMTPPAITRISALLQMLSELQHFQAYPGCQCKGCWLRVEPAFSVHEEEVVRIALCGC